jgi:hypothetical protein
LGKNNNNNNNNNINKNNNKNKKMAETERVYSVSNVPETHFLRSES